MDIDPAIRDLLDFSDSPWCVAAKRPKIQSAKPFVIPPPCKQAPAVEKFLNRLRCK